MAKEFSSAIVINEVNDNGKIKRSGSVRTYKSPGINTYHKLSNEQIKLLMALPANPLNLERRIRKTLKARGNKKRRPKGRSSKRKTTKRRTKKRRTRRRR